MWSRFVLGFLLAITTLIPESDGETVKTPLKSKADIFRLLLNQETLIRSALEKKVFGLVNDVRDMTEIMVNNKKEIVYLKNENQELKAKTIKQLRDAKIKMVRLRKENQDLQAETSKQLKIAEEESVALRNEIQALKAKFQSQANVTKLLSGISTPKFGTKDRLLHFQIKPNLYISYDLSICLFITPKKLMLKNPRKPTESCRLLFCH